MEHLPYSVVTDTGDTFDIAFPLSEHTQDRVRVHQLLTTIMNALASDLKVMGEVSNGDILQAATMAVAIRARMIHAPEETLRSIVADLMQTSLEACFGAERKSIPAGHG